MKTLIKSLKLVAFTVLAIGFSSCSKGKTEGVISVVNLADSAPVPGATVTLSITPPPGKTADGFYLCSEGLTQTAKYTTGTSGATEKICFELPAVISISVTGPNGKTGVGTLSLVEEETETAVVKIN